MNEQLKSIIGAGVKAARGASGLTQAVLAEAAGRTTGAISNIERGGSLPLLDLLERIAQVLGCTIAALVEMPAADGASVERGCRPSS